MRNRLIERIYWNGYWDGYTEGRQNVILDYLENRFNLSSFDIRDKIRIIKDIDALSLLQKKLHKAETEQQAIQRIEEFRQ